MSKRPTLTHYVPPPARSHRDRAASVSRSRALAIPLPLVAGASPPPAPSPPRGAERDRDLFEFDVVGESNRVPEKLREIGRLDGKRGDGMRERDGIRERDGMRGDREREGMRGEGMRVREPAHVKNGRRYGEMERAFPEMPRRKEVARGTPVLNRREPEDPEYWLRNTKGVNISVAANPPGSSRRKVSGDASSTPFKTLDYSPPRDRAPLHHHQDSNNPSPAPPRYKILTHAPPRPSPSQPPRRQQAYIPRPLGLNLSDLTSKSTLEERVHIYLSTLNPEFPDPPEEDMPFEYPETRLVDRSGLPKPGFRTKREEIERERLEGRRREGASGSGMGKRVPPPPGMGVVGAPHAPRSYRIQT